VRSARVGPDGQWRVPLPGVDTGVYTLRVDSIAPDGAVSSRVETPFKREEPDVLAAAEQQAAEAVAVGRMISAVTIQPGHTLWAIAEDRYGEGVQYVRIFSANRDQIRDPDLIYPGQVFTLPDAD
jgi:nucleoid-associated protein YgaU